MINLRIKKGLIVLGESYCMFVFECVCVCIIMWHKRAIKSNMENCSVRMYTRAVVLETSRSQRISRCVEGTPPSRSGRRRQFLLKSADGCRERIGLRTTPYNLITVYCIIYTFSFCAAANLHQNPLDFSFTGHIFMSWIRML